MAKKMDDMYLTFTIMMAMTPMAIIRKRNAIMQPKEINEVSKTSNN